MPAEAPDTPPAREGAQPEPATQADLRALRRWILVAGVWAVAATAVALIALLDTSGDDAKESARGLGERTDTLEQRQDGIRKRLGEVDAQVEGLAPATDLSRLQDRLERAETDAAAAKKDAKAADDKLTGLQDRIGTLEEDPGANGGTPGSADDDAQAP